MAEVVEINQRGVRVAKEAKRSPRRIRPWALLAIGMVVVVVALVVIVSPFDSARSNGQTGYAPVMTLTGVGPGSPVVMAGPAPSVAPPAPDGRTAVSRYLDAEIARDHATSFGQLSAQERAALGSYDNWASDADARPRYLSYRIVEVRDASVNAAVDMAPDVSEVFGWRPAAATIEFALKRQDGGVRISLEESKVTARFADEGLAAGAAVAWVQAAQRCDASAREKLEYGGNLLGSLRLEALLCAASGTPQATATGGLDTLDDPSVVLNAFGEQAATWSRVVTIGFGSKTGLHVVLAPLGERWVVVGGLVR